MTKYLALVAGAAILTAATFSYAQTTPPGADRGSGQPSDATSAQPNPDKKGKRATVAPNTAGVPTPPPPSTDSPSGQSGDFTSGQANPDKK